jgi:hypothetical protein
MDVKFTSFVKGQNWVIGTAGDDYEFSAKLFDSGSDYGINGGRVSKLSIRGVSAKYDDAPYNGTIVNYDRGWDIHPKITEEREVFQAVLKFLENAPKTRFSE